MHTAFPGCDYSPRNADALRIARDIMANLEWDRPGTDETPHRRRVMIRGIAGIMRWITSGRSNAQAIARSQTIPISPSSAPITVRHRVRTRPHRSQAMHHHQQWSARSGEPTRDAFHSGLLQSRTPLLYLNNNRLHGRKAYEEAGMISMARK